MPTDKNDPLKYQPVAPWLEDLVNKEDAARAPAPTPAAPTPAAPAIPVAKEPIAPSLVPDAVVPPKVDAPIIPAPAVPVIPPILDTKTDVLDPKKIVPTPGLETKVLDTTPAPAATPTSAPVATPAPAPAAPAVPFAGK